MSEQQIEIVHTLVEKEKLIPIENSGLIRFKLRKQRIPFFERQYKLQKSYLSADDINTTWQEILKEENKELEACAKIIPQHVDYSSDGRGRRKMRAFVR